MYRLILALIATPVALLLAAPVFILSIPFMIVRWLTDAIARRLEPEALPWTEIVEFKPTIGWKPKPNLDTHYISRDDDICHFRTDAEGWTGTGSVSDSDIVVFGDSYAFGYGVDSKHSFAEQCTTPRIKAIGAPGYNMVQELLLMRQFSPALRGKLAVWFICLENDLYDNLTPHKPNFYTTPFVRSLNGTGEWEIVTHHVSSGRLRLSPDGSPYYSMLAKFCTEGFFSERAFSACDFLIREAGGICKRAGAQLVLLTIPNKYQLTEEGVAYLASHASSANGLNVDLPDKHLELICRRWGVRFVAGKNYLQLSDYKMYDTHWNEQGNQRIAELLAGIYREHQQRGARNSEREAG